MVYQVKFIIYNDSLTMLNNTKSFMVHYLATTDYGPDKNCDKLSLLTTGQIRTVTSCHY